MCGGYLLSDGLLLSEAPVRSSDPQKFPHFANIAGSYGAIDFIKKNVSFLLSSVVTVASPSHL